jgi:hypothetical protein
VPGGPIWLRMRRQGLARLGQPSLKARNV